MLKIDSANSLSDFHTKLGDQGLHVDARESDRQIEKQEQEAWCARRLFLALVDNGLIEFPLSISQREEPDFQITENYNSYWLEITRAISEADAREWSLAQREEIGIYYIGDFGGRKAQDNLSSAAEITYNIQAAINKKSTKSYVYSNPTDLLIYIDGNNVVWLDSERADENGKTYQDLVCLFPYENTEHFKRIFLLWNSGKVSQFKKTSSEKHFHLSTDLVHTLKKLR